MAVALREPRIIIDFEPSDPPAEENRDETPSTLGGFLAEMARRYGDAPALAVKPGFRTQVTTYVELDAMASRVGRFLQERGVRKGDRVLIWSPNVPAWVAAFFGCHRIGAVVVPLDVRSSASFVSAVVEQIEPKVVFVSRQTKSYAAAIGLSGVLLEELEQIVSAMDSPPSSTRGEGVRPDDLAEIMFTSGTTGAPKGVMLTHRNVLSNVAGAGQVIRIEPRFRLLSLLPLSHMLEQTVGLLAPLSGGCRVVYPTSRQPGLLFRAIDEQRVTMLVVVPQALQLFMNAIEREAKRQGNGEALERLFGLAEHLPMPVRRVLFRRVHRRLGGCLETIVCGGAFLDPALAHRWELMGVTVLQGYGATEASPIISCDRPGARRPGAVGRAFPGVDLRIQSDGEILAKGPNIFRGYWQNPDATRGALDGGWYRTGDLGEIDEDGYLHLKGRKKDLIVLTNGQNVYPEDLEAELKREPGVTDAVVMGLDRPGGSVQVHAILLTEDPSQAAEAVRQVNRRVATHQQIRGHTVWPDEDFPRTHTLKVKKQEVLQRLPGIYELDSREAEAAAKLTRASLVALAGEDEGDGRPPLPLGEGWGEGVTPSYHSNVEAGNEARPRPRPLPEGEGATDSPGGAEGPTLGERENPLIGIVAELSGVPAGQIQADCTLGGQLGLDSLSRVELLSAIEEELGAYVDETTVGPETTVAELARLVAQATPRADADAGVTWPLHPVASAAREVFLQGVVFPLFHLFWERKIYGREHLEGLAGPVIIASSHHFMVQPGCSGDPPAIWMALPRRLRMRVSTAADPEAAFGTWWKGFVSRLLGAFPIAKQGSVRTSLETMGRMLDIGRSVLIFPEGQGYDGGALRPFMGGTGLMAVECRTPVVPVWVEVERRSIITSNPGRGRGAYSLYIGEPLMLDPATPPAEATRRIAEAVQALDPRSSPIAMGEAR